MRRSRARIAIFLVLVTTSAWLGGSTAASRRWELPSYSPCSSLWLGRNDFTDIAYSPKDNHLWGVTSGHDAALHAYDLDGALVRSLRSPEPVLLKGVTWIQGELLALTLPGQQRLAYANIDSKQTELRLQYVQFRHNTVDMQDKLTYNAEAKTLLLTDLGFTDFAAQPSTDTALSLVMLNGVVRKTTDSKIAVSNVTDVYYASQPRRLFVLSGQELLELDDSGNVASRLNLEAQVQRPVGLTFAPDGGKFMVLGADGQVHIFSSQGCRKSEGRRGLKPAARKPLSLPQDSRQQQAAPVSYTFRHGADEEEDDLEDFSIPPITESVALAAHEGRLVSDRDEGTLDEYGMQASHLATAAAARDSRQSDIFLYYWRLPVGRREFMSSYSVCQAFNLTGTQPGQRFAGLAYNPERRSLSTVTGSPAALAEYSIAGVLEQEARLMSSGHAPAGVAHLGENLYSVLDSSLVMESVDIQDAPASNKRLRLQTPRLLEHTHLRGVSWDDEAGRFFVAQSQPPAVWSLAEGSPPVLLFTAVDLPIEDITGLSHNRMTNTLLLLSQRSRRLIETSTTGELVHSMELGSSLTDEPHSLTVAGGGKVLFLLSDSGNLKIFSVAKC